MILIYSGGMDSTTLLYEYKDKITLALNFNYGSKHHLMEYFWAIVNAKELNIPLIGIDLPFVKKHFRSNLLLNGDPIPEGHYEDPSMKQTVVPFRNGIMLSIAVGIAESKEINTVLYANHAGDHAIYPDCRESFYNAINQAAQEGTYNRVKILSPYLHLTKREIALRGKDLGVPFERTYSCYKGEVLHCGKCGTCAERKEALQGFDQTFYQSEVVS